MDERGSIICLDRRNGSHKEHHKDGARSEMNNARADRGNQ